MMTTRHAYVTALFVSSVLTVACSSQHKPGFTADVKPILDKHCAECHMPDGEGAKQSGFQIDSYASIMKGTKFVPVIVPGSAESSTLYILVAGKANPKINMPHGKAPLTPAEIETIKLWIDQGAHDN